MIPSPEPSGLVWSSQECIDSTPCKISDRLIPGLFERHSVNVGAPRQMFRAVLTDERRQRVHRCQALVAGRDRTLPRFFDVPQEPLYEIGAYVFDEKFIRSFAQGRARECDEQPQGVAIAVLRITSEVAVGGRYSSRKRLIQGARACLSFIDASRDIPFEATICLFEKFRCHRQISLRRAQRTVPEVCR